MKTVASIGLLLGVVSLAPWAASAAPSAPDKKLVQTVLSGDWAAVLAQCGEDDQLAGQPVTRAIKGHACLALNDNDESLKMFQSVASQADRAKWHAWATEFAVTVTNRQETAKTAKARAKYFEGDALARLGKWDDAGQCYREATELDAQCALAWNALGVACVYQKKGPDVAKRLAEARRCFEEACRIQPAFADAHANLGIYYVATGGAEGAITEFTMAIDCAKPKNFSLARVGRACAILGKSRSNKSLEEAAADLALAASCPGVHALARENANKTSEKLTAAEAGEKGQDYGPGTNVRSETNKVHNAMLQAPPGQEPKVAERLKSQYTGPQWSAIQAQEAKDRKHNVNWIPHLPESLTVRANAEGMAGAGAVVAGVAGAAGGGIAGAAGGGKAGAAGGGIAGAAGGGIAGAGARGGAGVGVSATWPIRSDTQKNIKAADYILAAGQPQRGGAATDGATTGIGRVSPARGGAAPGGFTPGGATTEGLALAEAEGDTGLWLTKSTWFGLAPGVPLPEVQSY